MGGGLLQFVFCCLVTAGLGSRIQPCPRQAVAHEFGWRTIRQRPSRSRRKGRGPWEQQRRQLREAGRTPPHTPTPTGKDPIADESCLFESPRRLFSDSVFWALSKLFLKVPGGPLPTLSVPTLAVLRREPPSLACPSGRGRSGPHMVCWSGGSSDRETVGRDDGRHSFRRVVRVDSIFARGFVLFIVGAAMGGMVSFSEIPVCKVWLVGFLGGRRRL